MRSRAKGKIEGVPRERKVGPLRRELNRLAQQLEEAGAERRVLEDENRRLRTMWATRESRIAELSNQLEDLEERFGMLVDYARAGDRLAMVLVRLDRPISRASDNEPQTQAMAVPEFLRRRTA